MIELLQKVSLFRGLTVDQLQAIEALCAKRSYPPGTVLFREKDMG